MTIEKGDIVSFRSAVPATPVYPLETAKQAAARASREAGQELPLQEQEAEVVGFSAAHSDDDPHLNLRLKDGTLITGSTPAVDGGPGWFLG